MGSMMAFPSSLIIAVVMMAVVVTSSPHFAHSHSSSSTTTTLSSSSSTTASSSNPIKHFVVLMMENRSFDHMLGWLKRLNSQIDGLTGEECNLMYVRDPQSECVYVQEHGYDESPDDPRHEFDPVTFQIYGEHARNKTAPDMSGFVDNARRWGLNTTNIMNMFTINIDSAPILNTLAMEYVVFDKYYSSIPGPTDPNRAFFMSGTSNGELQNFNGTLWLQQSYFDFLTQHGVQWNAFYEDDPWAVMYFNDTHEWENRKNIHVLDVFFDNLKNEKLATFTLLQPRMNGNIQGGPTWQHPDASVKEGEKLIKRVYEALRESEFWESTAFFINYDEHGGFYDHVAPPQEGVPSPDNVTAANGFTFDRLGVRVPAVLISPWVEKGFVEGEAEGPFPTSQYDHTSVMATVNRMLNITDHLGDREAWAGTFEHLFQMRSSPRRDCVRKLPELPPYTKEELLRQWAKPLNDHLEIQVQFYCQFNHPQEEECGKHITNQYEAAVFFEREIKTFLKDRDMI